MTNGLQFLTRKPGDEWIREELNHSGVYIGEVLSAKGKPPKEAKIPIIRILIQMALSVQRLFRPDFASFRLAYMSNVSLHLAANSYKRA